MDLWAWVTDATAALRREGRADLAAMVDRLPRLVVDDDHARVDAMIPGALAAARAVGSPWLEVFLKHWELQSRVLHRGEGKAALRDAVALVDRSHREDTRACPQSVCAIQDLCACYANADGPGYAAERVAASRETLARIDPTWPCWSCVGTELTDALLDDARPEAALAELDALEGAAVRAGGTEAKWSFEKARIRILRALDRHEEALALADAGQRFGRRDVNEDHTRALNRARAFVGLGRFADADRALPSYDVVAATAEHAPDWFAVAEALVGAGVWVNDGALGRRLDAQVAILARQGCPRDAIALAAIGVRLAVARGATESARHLVGVLEAQLPELARPLDAPAVLAEARRRLAEAEAGVALPATPEDVLAEADGADAEADLARLEPALRAWPDHEGLADRTARARLVVGRPRDALALVEGRLVDGSSEEHRGLVIAAALGTRDHDVVARVAARFRALSVEPWWADWLLGRHALDHGDPESARRHLRHVADAVPSGRNVRRLLAEAAAMAGDHADALSWYDALLALGDDEPGNDREAMVSATLVGAWDRVRASAVRLGYNFPGEGPIFVSWTLCRIRMEVDGVEQDLWARRTGPVTARILAMTPSDRPQVWGTDVVFRPTPLNRVDPADEEPVHVFPLVKQVGRVATWTFEIDGVRPDHWPEIEAALDAFGGECRVLSTPDYAFGDGLPGVYARVVVPEAVAPREVHEALGARCAGLAHPLLWPGLAELAGDHEAAARMRAAT